MTTNSNDSNHNEPQAVGPQPLPEGYLWRLAVIVCLFVSGGICMIFFNGLLGSILSLAGFAFGKFSGLNEMVDRSLKK